MVPKPLSLNHYEYINQLLKLQKAKELTPQTEIANKDKEEIIQNLQDEQIKLNAMQNEAEREANLLKIQRALEILKDDEKKKHYDEAITAKPNTQLNIKGTREIELVPLVPIEDIINEFDAFKNEMLGKKDKDGKSLYAEGDFKYEKKPGPPEMHVFYFPDEASANAFIERLFNNNMVMLPNGSQDINSLKSAQTQHQFKSRLNNLSSAQPSKQENEESSSPTPLNITPTKS